ncbi:MAG: cellulase family glycosylhydrolase [Saprospiraceae bacterium]|nr:cellulase family glycosylhydrolase [Saprospiraceae bacterium]MCB9325032.1 cellulase family glycosylhydrolase [Lewinellaceae bacterium]
MKFITTAFLLLILSIGLSAQNPFITVEDGKFVLDEKPYYFIGTNLWFGMWLGSAGAAGDRERLVRELDRLQALGVNNLRVTAGSEGPVDAPWRVQPAVQYEAKKYDETLLEGLDFLLAEMDKRGMKAVLVLNNFFQWSGGMAQYVSWATGEPIPYPHLEGHSWDEFQQFSAQFYSNKKAQQISKKFMKKLLRRRNSVSGIQYREDPTIMAWQLANEPRGFGQVPAYLEWADKTAGVIQRKDKNHLVSLGGEGKTSAESTGTDFENVSKSKNLDYLTAHLWAENWSWYAPDQPETFEQALVNSLAYLNDHIAIAGKLGKPLVFEEFGVSRDGRDYDPEAPTILRDQYYTFFFDVLLQNISTGSAFMGCNFWSWAGEGRPKEPGAFWKKGDPLIGDPPHESQGWYSVYEKDESTIEIIKNYAQKIKQESE